MKLIRLTTKTFKKLNDADIRFTEGLNALIGENARGKSTTLRAIMIALYGVSTDPMKKEDLPTWGAKDFSIRLHLEHKGTEYIVTRSMKNAKVTDLDGKELASGHTPCTKFFTDLLGMNYKQICMFVLSCQGETAGVLTFGATELQRRVESFSGADIIDKVLKLTRTRLTTLTGKLSAYAVVDLEELKRTEETVQGTYDRSYAEHIAEGEHCQQLKKQHDSVSEEVDQLKKLQLIHRNLNKEYSDIDVRRQSVQAQIDAVFPDGQAPQRIDNQKLTQLMNQEGGLRSMYNDALRDLNESEETQKLIDALGRDLDELQVEHEKSSRISKRLNDLQVQLSNFQDQESNSRAEKRAAHKELGTARIAEASGVCSECDRPYEDHDPELLKKAVAIAEENFNKWDGENLRHFKAVEEVKKQIADLPEFSTDTLARIDILEKKRETYRQQLEGMVIPTAEHVENLKARHDEALSQVTLLKASVDENHKLCQQYASYTGQLDQIRERLASIQAEIDGLDPFTEQSLEDAVDTRHQLSQQMGEGEKRYLEATNEMRLSHYELKDIQRNISAGEENNRAAADLSQNIDLHKALIKFLSDSRANYLSQVWNQILGVASQHLKVSTGGVITRISRNSDGDFQYEDEGKWTPIEAASGAQKGFLGVALRIGLSSALYGNTGLLILDEPTEAMSEVNAQALAGSLMGQTGQCLLVTHRNLERVSSQNVIEIGSP